MLESFRRFTSKDKKTHTYIEPYEGWGSLCDKIKSTVKYRKMGFTRPYVHLFAPDFQIGDKGYPLFAKEICHFSRVHSQIAIMNSIATWSYFALSSDHSETPPEFKYDSVKNLHYLESRSEPWVFYAERDVYNTNINHSWDLLLINNNPPIYGAGLEFVIFLVPKFTEADKL